jgi:outer membrane immunogenic protein
MKRLLLSSVVLTAFAIGPVAAADLGARYPAPPRGPVGYDPIFTWTGFYIGANGGWASADKCWTFVGTTLAAAAPRDEGCHTADGGVFGGQVGYNWQAGNWVFGLEAQGDWADLTGSNVSLAFPAFTNRTRVDALGLFTGRIGWAWNTTLLYAKGGGALARDRYDYITTTTGVLGGTASETRVGWTVGAGLEYAFAPNWSLGVEYNYVGLDKERNTFGPLPNVVEDIDQHIHMVTGRINYRFGYGGPVRANY